MEAGEGSWAATYYKNCHIPGSSSALSQREPRGGAWWESVLEAPELVVRQLYGYFPISFSLVFLGTWIHFHELSSCLEFQFCFFLRSVSVRV